MHSNIILTLKTLFYSGDRKDYTFDKYCTAHVEQHNPLTALLEFGVKGIDEAMKIHYFQEGIKDDSFNSVKTTILVDRSKFQDFNSVMNLYANFKRAQKNDIVPQGRTILALNKGRGGSGRGRSRSGRGRGRGRGRGGNSRASGLVPQEENRQGDRCRAQDLPTQDLQQFYPCPEGQALATEEPRQDPREWTH
jgi:hypothetical protein